MLYVVLRVGSERYAIDANEVVSVLPLVNLTPVPRAVSGAAALFTYRGTPVPVIDMARHVGAGPMQARLQTRIVLVRNAAAGPGGRAGLLVDGAIGTFSCGGDQFQAPGLVRPAFCDGVTSVGGSVLQRLDVNRLLSWSADRQPGQEERSQ